VFRKNAFHSLTSSESGASPQRTTHGDDFVEFCHALYLLSYRPLKLTHGWFLGTQEKSYFTGENFVKK
jgi:hypothetical protein